MTRPDPVLLKHYLILSLCSGPFFPVVFLAHYCRYITLRYRFDDDGIWMAWGVLFKRETNLAYRRVQDINVTRGVIQRWLGLASVAVQTASANSMPEMKIEGVLDADGLRDFLYAKMRGAKGQADAPGDAAGDGGADGPDEALALLVEIRDGVSSLRERVDALEATRLGDNGAAS
ncbi:MAG: PH domain-containing protein [Phycisphaerales bacterium JB054]